MAMQYREAVFDSIADPQHEQTRLGCTPQTIYICRLLLVCLLYTSDAADE